MSALDVGSPRIVKIVNGMRGLRGDRKGFPISRNLSLKLFDIFIIVIRGHRVLTSFVLEFASARGVSQTICGCVSGS